MDEISVDCIKNCEASSCDLPQRDEFYTIEQVQGQSSLSLWLNCVAPYLKPGGKTVALILALGVVSIPLGLLSVVTGNSPVFLILALGSVCVAVRGASGPC